MATVTGSPSEAGLVCGHWIMPMLCSGGRTAKISNKLAGDVACLGGSMVEHQPGLLGSRVRFPAGAFAIFCVSAKASFPISLPSFPSSFFPFLFLSLLLPLPSTFHLRFKIPHECFPERTMANSPSTFLRLSLHFRCLLLQAFNWPCKKSILVLKRCSRSLAYARSACSSIVRSFTALKKESNAFVKAPPKHFPTPDFPTW